MTFDDSFFTKAQEVNMTQQKAVNDGRKLGTLQDHGIFLGPDAPAHLKNKLYPMATPEEIQSNWDSRERDGLYQKFGPGATIMCLFYDPVKKAHAMPGDPPSELMKRATVEDLDRLWTDYFRRYPKPLNRSGTKKFLAAVAEEAARRGIL